MSATGWLPYLLRDRAVRSIPLWILATGLTVSFLLALFFLSERVQGGRGGPGPPAAQGPGSPLGRQAEAAGPGPARGQGQHGQHLVEKKSKKNHFSHARFEKSDQVSPFLECFLDKLLYLKREL